MTDKEIWVAAFIAGTEFVIDTMIRAGLVDETSRDFLLQGVDKLAEAKWTLLTA